MLEEEEVYGAVRHLFQNRVGGPSGMRAEHIWACLMETTQEEFPDPSQWEMVVGLTQAAFREGHLAE